MNFIFLLLSMFTLSSCVVNENFSPENSLTFDYMQTGNARSDAGVAINKHNFTLIGFDQRGLVVPGVNSEKTGTCLIKRIDGMGDVVRSPEHLQQRRKVHKYSEIYNLKILQSSSCHQ